MSAQLFVASRNAKKIAEMERILAALVPGVQVLGLDDVDFFEEPVEDAPTFEGNALIKARAGFAATGLPSVADDSGLCVDALNGMPGVLSARWGGRPKSDERNNQLLLDQLGDVPDERRQAHFSCVIAFAYDGGELVVEGRMDGRVIRDLRGTGGFGYDGLFVAEETPDGRTSAELSVAEKDAISHRGRALREIGPKIAAVLAG
ncbi:RdgB/HAM1 family non-canonical purine NTP pyrophosphatase [Nocardioides sp. BP30]|uniref:RdgB/HAM1 family non-canonical purine NTP pyrophosphatase n=1 Tax=Nocardioides sp. BP30 TaxID=3036374 RepID=UPI0024693980|nr:RdgB/HAM1 family non-canonical purine NTP pyrophosphatase [Nocardioides sp. BP30]WGL53557.1 RdgB/HAM1 family non-canonical purine NTP pyrophosphatase [Nocardioides sp. BP30]